LDYVLTTKTKPGAPVIIIGAHGAGGGAPVFSSSVLRSSLELSDTKVYEPQIRALPGTADAPVIIIGAHGAWGGRRGAVAGI